MASKLYSFLQKHPVSLPIKRIWSRDCPDLAQNFDWDAVWSSIKEASRNPDHQQIHFNFLHRTYLTPIKLHMKIINDPCCNLCLLKAQGTYIHMFWDCPPVQSFWSNIAAKFLTHEMVPVTICTSILDDLSVLNVSQKANNFCQTDSS